ncbi:MAG: aminomethyl-transferring glycine dehydrogenase subunit GcvPA, partial [Chloroflexota bacterium]|nr:aminomethyl-transferring glycine dehydrogenase subunit GcvPA [Chloroflexota bacterium]
ANAGMYDGATSLAEAVLMACRVTKREKVALVDTVSPAYSAVIHTYCQSQDIAVETVSPSNVVLDDETACLVLQYPNYFGNIEDMQNLIDMAHAQGALAVVSTDPTAMGMFQTPGHYGADIVTGDGQPLGIPSSFGGPFVGLFVTKQEYIRQMPSRLSGRTVDKNGKTGYVLTLQTREQHIRRERATSNICTNEALYALASTIYLAAMGKHGLRQVAELCYHKAHYAAAKIGELPGYSLPIEGPFFQEFVVQCPSAPADINKKLMEQNILGGLDVSERVPNGMLLCVTEMSSQDDIHALVAALSEFK